MTDFNSVPNPSAHLSRALREGGVKASIDCLESDLIAEVEAIKRKVGRREKLTHDEIKTLNEYKNHRISTAIDVAQRRIIKHVKIKPSDDIEEQRSKVGIAKEVTGFIPKLAEFISEKTGAIISAIGNTIATIGCEIKSFFTSLWSWIPG